MPRYFRHPPNAPISCRQVVELVTAYLDGALDARMTRRVEVHLALCEGCRVYLEQMRLTIAGLSRCEPPPLPEDVCRDLAEAFRTRRPRRLS